ncbi:MAG TPA: non-homologous end-joining DNA ligase [Polyangiaceae bacterium]|nr:non-homologous end-joining DNA ligase [Polyangiaceae bacterium]
MPRSPVRGRARGHARTGTAVSALAAKIRNVQLATPVKEVPPGAWIYELSWDGYRILAHKSGTDVCLRGRRGNDWTGEFSVVADAVANLSTKECVIDGEICAIGSNGVPSFQLLQKSGGKDANLLFVVFDLLWVDGKDLRSKRLEERRARLESIVADAGPDSLVRMSTAVEGDPKQILATACEAGIEGIIAKQKRSLYTGGRDRTWLKVKCTLRQVAPPTPISPPNHPSRKSVSKAAKPTKTEHRLLVGGVSISHPDRVLDPAGITKLDLARYYERVGEEMLPHVKERPLTLMLWDPSARERGGKFMRHAHAWGPDVLRRVHIQEKTKVGEYLVVDNADGLIALAQMDVLEIHTWNSLAEDVEHPNRVVFDLDPAPDVPWARVVECAHYLRERLVALQLAAWPKTTGGKGVHVVVPLEPRADWAQCLEFTRAFADVMQTERPEDFVTTLSKAKRSGKILVDYLRNNRTNTTIAAFSIRARRHAPVSVPISWDELDASLKSDFFTLHNIGERIDKRGRDPWAGYFTRRQRLPRAAR